MLLIWAANSPHRQIHQGNFWYNLCAVRQILVHPPPLVGIGLWYVSENLGANVVVAPVVTSLSL